MSRPSALAPAPVPAWFAVVAAELNGGGPDVPHEMPERIPYGRQHDHLASLAGSMRRRGMGEAAIAAALISVNDEQCERPGPHENMRRLARSAMQWEPDKGPFKVTPASANTSERIQVLSLEVLDPKDIRNPRWGMKDFLINGNLNALYGVGGAGKTTLIGTTMAGWTTGRVPGIYEGTPINVLFIASEDAVAESWTPRIMACGGDLSRVRKMAHTQPFDLLDDSELLGNLVADWDVKAVYIDQILDHFNLELNTNAAQHVRAGLYGLREVAKGIELTAVFTGHPNKGRSTDIRSRMGGSHQFYDIPRVALALGFHRDDEDTRLLVRGKGTFGEKPSPLAFGLDKGFVVNERTEEVVEVMTAKNVGGAVKEADFVWDPPSEKRETDKDRAAQVIREIGADGKWHSRSEAAERCRELDIAVEGAFKHAFDETVPNDDKHREKRGKERWWRLSP